MILFQTPSSNKKFGVARFARCLIISFFLVSVVYLWNKILFLQLNLNIVSSHVLELENTLSDATSTIGDLESKILSLRDSQKDVTMKLDLLGNETIRKAQSKKLDQRRTIVTKAQGFDNDFVLKSLNQFEKKKNEYIKIDTQSTSKMPNTSEKTVIIGSKNETDKSISRNLLLENSSGNRKMFLLEIYLDDDYNETSWTLINKYSNVVVASDNNIGEQPDMKYVFSTNLDAGSYDFTIFDSFGDGIDCTRSRQGQSCYQLQINDKKINGSNFSSKTQHSFSVSLFDLGLVCVGHVFELKLDLSALSDVASKWNLQNEETNKIFLSEIIENQGESSIYTYTNCIDSGLYSLSIYDAEDNIIDCNNSSKRCSKLFINNNEVIIEQALPSIFFVSVDGRARESRCSDVFKRPVLSPINPITGVHFNTRIEHIMNIIESHSSGNDLVNHESPQYRAACFILFDDARNVTVEYPGLMERYVLSVLLYSTHQLAEVHLPYETCEYLDVVCNSNNFITELNWSRRNLKGILPNEIAHLAHLESLRIASNQIEGGIPSVLGTIDKLQRLEFFDNNISGTLPKEIGNLSQLNHFSASSLKGTIPSEIGNCRSLKYFAVVFSDLTGTIPPELFDATKLEWVYLTKNYLTGTISSKIGQLQNLKTLLLDSNKLNGSIPSEIGSLPSIVNIWLQNNQLNGTIPHSIGRCHYLREFILKNNALTGTLPNIFDYLINLRWLEISLNRLTGPIPHSLWKNNFSVSLDEFHPLKGQTPSNSLWESDSTGILNMRGNEMTGTVPKDFCSKLDEIGLDTRNWFRDKPKVNCACCNSENKCSLWNIENPVTLCQQENRKPYDFNYSITFYDKISDTTFLERGTLADSTTMCMSPTGCYEITRHNRDTSFLGYANSSHGREVDHCDPVVVCGNIIDKNHPKREGLNHLMQTVVPGIHVLDDPDSPHYITLCWMMAEESEDNEIDSLFFDFNVCDGTLLQRYAVAVFMFSQEKIFEETKSLRSELGSKKTCEWRSVECDGRKKYVTKILATGFNFSFTSLIPEVGRLERLETINITNNSLVGTIEPLVFESLQHLSVVDLSSNNLEGSIPDELLDLPSLRLLNLYNNTLVGTLPSLSKYSTTLEKFNVGDNLLTGSIPDGLTACHSLQAIDLSRNNHQGSISTEFGKMKNLREIKLYENEFTGSIPSEIFHANMIELFMLQSNKLTGSIPSEIGNLANATTVLVSHNRLQGSIPSGLNKLKNIVMLHFHHNQLTGSAPHINVSNFKNHTIESYITDCGSPSHALPKEMKCSSCTMCCNSDDRCQKAQDLRLTIPQIGVLTSFLSPIVVISITYIKYELGKFFPALISDTRKPFIFPADSVYHFGVSNDRRAQFVFTITAVIQMLLFYFYLEPSELDSEETDYQFSYICPSNNTTCTALISVDIIGWLMFVCVTVIYLAPDILRSFRLINKAICHKEIMLMLSGVIILGLATLALFTSTVYNIALAESNTDLIMNAVILLFINDLDEKILMIVQNIAPSWSNRIHEEVDNKLSTLSITVTRHNEKARL